MGNLENTDALQTSGLSRRSFLAGASLAAIGGAGLALFGCSPDAKDGQGGAPSAPAAASGSAEQASGIWAIDELAEPSETVQADVAIVGGGGTGTAAAIQCKQLGLNPIVVDCGQNYGGSFIGTEGMFGVETHWTKEAGEDLTLEESVHACLTYHHWIPNHQLYMNFFGQTPETVEWVEALGVKYRDVVSLGISDTTWHVYERTAKSSPGATFMEGLGNAAKDLGVEAYFETVGKKVIVEDGKVAGLLAEKKDGSVLKIEAPVVIIGSGGYSTNTDMIYELSELVNENIFSVGAEQRNGDGLKMAKDAGAAFAESPGTVMWCGPWIMGSAWGSDGYCASVQPTLWINQDAERFCNEDLWLDDFAAAGMAVRNQKRTYAVMSDADIEYFVNNGPYGPVFTFGQVGTPMADARKQLEDLDAVHIGDSLDDLAKEVDLDAAALKATVEAYNAACEEGIDKNFGKDAAYLKKIEAPYWICEVADGYYTTCGGIKITPNTEVVDMDGEVIPGLYAGGSDAGGLYGDSYDVSRAPGSQASWAINSGRLAAKHAAEYLGK
ncbi:FAD-dependent oxidoreductase [Raoultibacter phocaeensis]|uniref:FAD-dependent oxidoreductase n=1 Tax=Raoultibacter phocaeensis TaxID=2479841 RepID=UPI00111A3445|nr:FAD-binding protein [Raoultibacter phocaeensis]